MTPTADTVTAAQVEAGLTASWCYSDAFKDIYGYRPRTEYLNSPEYVAEFWNSFDELFDQVQAQDKADLETACEAAGIPVTTWAAYYDFVKAKLEREWFEQHQTELEAAEERAAFYRRGSPAPVIEAWAPCAQAYFIGDRYG